MLWRINFSRNQELSSLSKETFQRTEVETLKTIITISCLLRKNNSDTPFCDTSSVTMSHQARLGVIKLHLQSTPHYNIASCISREKAANDPEPGIEKNYLTPQGCSPYPMQSLMISLLFAHQFKCIFSRTICKIPSKDFINFRSLKTRSEAEKSSIKN